MEKRPEILSGHNIKVNINSSFMDISDISAIIKLDFHDVFGKLTLVCLCVLNYIVDLRHLGVQKIEMNTSAKITESTLVFFGHMRPFPCHVLKTTVCACLSQAS